jgi:hypothetical protein
MAADDLRSDRGVDVRQIEDAFLGGQLGVEHDLEEQVAELVGERGGRPAAQRVVDLVRLLEEMVAERLVGLLAVPRAAVGQSKPGRDPGHCPRAGDCELRGEWREVDRGRQVVGSELADRPLSARPEPPDRMIHGIEPSEEGDRVRAGRGVASRERLRIAVRDGVQDRRRDNEHRARWLDGRGHQTLGGDHLEAGREVEPPAEPRFGDERVEHRPAASSARGR